MVWEEASYPLTKGNLLVQHAEPINANLDVIRVTPTKWKIRKNLNNITAVPDC